MGSSATQVTSPFAVGFLSIVGSWRVSIMTSPKLPGRIVSFVRSIQSPACLGREPDGDLTHRGIPVSLLLQARCRAWSIQRACRCQWLGEDHAARYSYAAWGSPH